MSYNLTKQLPSCTVEKKLLLELESYVHRKIAELAPPFENIASALNQSFIIVDKFGVENLKSVEEFQRSYFPDDTRRISIEGRSVGKNSLSIEIAFAASKSGSNLTVSFVGNSAREVVTGIAAEIISIIESYKTANHLFYHLGSFPAGFILGIVTYVSLIGFANYRPSQEDSLTNTLINIMVAIGTMAITLVFIEKFRPYSTFETRRNEKRRRQLNWIILGVIGFILFTVVGVFFRVKLLGF